MQRERCRQPFFSFECVVYCMIEEVGCFLKEVCSYNLQHFLWDSKSFLHLYQHVMWNKLSESFNVSRIWKSSLHSCEGTRTRQPKGKQGSQCDMYFTSHFSNCSCVSHIFHLYNLNARTLSTDLVLSSPVCYSFVCQECLWQECLWQECLWQECLWLQYTFTKCFLN